MFDLGLDLVAALVTVLDAGDVGEGAAVLEHVGAYLAHTVKGGAAERGNEDMAALVFRRVIQFIPNTHTKHIIPAFVKIDIDHSRFTIHLTFLDDFELCLSQSML